MNEVRCPNCATTFVVGNESTTAELARIAESAGASAFTQTVTCPACGIQIETRPGAEPEVEPPRETATAGMTAQEIYDLGYPGDFGSSAWDDDDPNWPGPSAESPTHEPTRTDQAEPERPSILFLIGKWVMRGKADLKASEHDV